MRLKQIWMIVGALGVIGTLVLGWFLLVRPLVDGALQAEEETRQAEVSNDGLEAQIALLAEEFEGINDLRAQLDEVLSSIPGQLDLAQLVRLLAAAQEGSGARIVSLTLGDAVVYGSAVPQVVAPPPAEQATEDEGASATPDAPAPAVPAGGSVVMAPADPADSLRLTSAGMVLVPIDLQVSGNPDQVLALVGALQRMSRLFLVTEVEVIGGEAPSGSINGYVYVLPQAQILALETEPTATPTPTPSPEASP